MEDSPHLGALSLSSPSGSDGDATIGVAPAGIEADLAAATGVAERVGRFVVLRELGRGAMGVVLAAYDEALDRRVAIKLLAASKTARSAGAQRIRREAQALAMLSHPNVVHVYEVGEHEGITFIAMEFVLGATLRDYLAAGHARNSVLDAVMQAGRGLAAAHAAGLTHRDFKPANVLVGDDGRVRVVDFGLARVAARELPSQDDFASIDSVERDERASAPERSGSLRDEGPLTVTGTLLGTPGYMAPEQARGRAADARSDQYAFGVVLYEAIIGKRPPTADERSSGAELAFDVNANVPSALRTILKRALAMKPADRFESMDALLAALERQRGPLRIRWVLATIAGMGLGAAGLLLGTTTTEPCADSGRAVEAIWSASARGAVQDALSHNVEPYATASTQRLLRVVDRWTATWATTRHEACSATAITGEQSPALLDRRMLCLDQALDSLRSSVNLLATADAELAAKAATVVDGLPSLSSCSNAEGLMADLAPPDDPIVAAEVASLRALLADARVNYSAGRYEVSLTTATRVLEAAAPLGYPPLTIEARVAIGVARGKGGNVTEGRNALAEVFWDAVALGHDKLAVQAGRTLVFLAGHQLGQFDDAERWWAATDAIVRRRGQIHEDRLALAIGWGSALKRAGKFDRAREQFEGALSLATDRDGPDCSDCAVLYNNLGAVAQGLGEVEAALDFFERAKARFDEEYGPDHPLIGYSHANLAAIYAQTKRFDEAAVAYDRALAIWSGTLADDHQDVVMVRGQRGMVLAGAGRVEDGRAEIQRIIDALERADAPPMALADAYNQLATVSEPEQAVASFETSRRLREDNGLIDDSLARTLVGLAQALVTLGRTQQAGAHASRALEILRAQNPPNAARIEEATAVLDSASAVGHNVE